MSSPGQTNALENVGGGRRRYVVLLFADVCRYTELSEAIDPEELDLLRHQIEELALAAIGKHDGTVSQVYGDGVLAVFGYPKSQEDDARRAVDAALELHQATRTARWRASVPAGFEVRMHSAVHAGLVFVREGDALHGHYELSGDAVNTAARLCAAAARDEILVSDAAIRGIEAYFTTEVSAPFSLKGKRQPVVVHRVSGRTAVQTRFEARERGGLTRFVGREAELERLSLLYRAANDGAQQTAFVRGAPGIGKSRMLEEFRRRVSAKGARVLRGCCESYGEAAPLEPFRQTVCDLFGAQPVHRAEEVARAVHLGTERLGSTVREHADSFLQLLSLRPWPASGGRRTAGLPVVRALSHLLLTLGSRESVVLILDDWQWADDASRSVLDQVVRETPKSRLCIVVGARAGTRIDPVLQDAEVFSLQPLTEAESASMIRVLRPRILDLGVTRAIHERTGGNPLFLEELCRSLPDDVVAGEQALEQSGVPSTLQGLIQARISRLPPQPARVLRVASVIGNEFSVPLLSRALPNEDVVTVLDKLARGDLIHATELEQSYRFKHGITREVIYESVRMAERRQMHRAIAVAIEQTGGADAHEALSYHYRGCADHLQGASYAERAGDKALSASSLDRARFHYSVALAELERLPPTLEQRRRWLAIHEKWAGVYVYSPSRHQLSTLRTATAYAAEIGDLRAQAFTAHWRGWIHYVLGEYDEAIARSRDGLALAEQLGEQRLVAQLLVSLGQYHAAAGESEEALSHLDRGLSLKRRHADGSAGRIVAQGFAYALGCKAAMHADLGDFATAQSDLDEALSAVSGKGHAIEGSLLALASMVELYRGAFEACVETTLRCRLIAERVNSAYVYATASVFGAYARWQLERTDSALQEIARAVEWLDARDTGLYSSLNYGCLSEAYAEHGDAARALVFAERAFERKRQRDPLGETLAHRARARVLAAGGPERAPEAQAALREAFESAQARGSARDAALTRLAVAELAAQAGDRGEAERSAGQALSEFERMGMAFYASRARGHVPEQG